MRNVTVVLLSLMAAIPMGLARGAEPTIRVVVWDEQQPAQQEAYENFLGNSIAEHLAKDQAFRVISASLDQPDKGLSASLLESTDVLIWWGHARHDDVPEELAKSIVARVQRGQLALIALHSAHWARPFVEAMNERTRQDARGRYPDPPGGPPVEFEFIAPGGRFVPTADSLVTPAYYATRRGNRLHVRVDLPNCVFPAYRNDGQPSRLRVLRPDHPICRGLPESFELPRTEMYNDPFHVPAADEVLFEETWEAGERFRSGLIWRIGAGRVFYFRPGHETFPVYRQQLPLQIIANATRWLATAE